MDGLTSTSYALLGLLALRDWSTYELARQLPRSVGMAWPRAESRLYSEARKLAELGLATRDEPTGRRPRTVYSVTDAGRDAVAQWLATPAAGPVLEFEGMLKVSFGELGDRAALVAGSPRSPRRRRRRSRSAPPSPRPTARGTGRSPERLHVSGLAWRFLHDHFGMVRDWARWAPAEVETWPDTANPPGGPLAAFERYLPSP